MKQEISLGDTVRFIITSYFELSKSEYNMPYLFNDPASNLTAVMLGGCYQIMQIAKNKWGTKICTISFNNQVVSKDMPISYFKKYSVAQNCTFRKGDTVFFKPKSSIKDVEFVTRCFPKINFFHVDSLFTIERLINFYYVIVKVKSGEIIDFPLLWTDFELYEK